MVFPPNFAVFFGGGYVEEYAWLSWVGFNTSFIYCISHNLQYSLVFSCLSTVRHGLKQF